MPYESITFAQLKARLAARYESVPYWTDAEAGYALNEGICTWGMLTGRWKTRVVITTTPNSYELPLPAAMSFRMRLTFDGQPLVSTARFDLDNGRPAWRAESTASGGTTPTVPTLWAPVSLQLVYIWPMDAVGHHSWGVDGVLTPPVLVDNADFVNLAEADVSLLLGFALHVLAFKKGGDYFGATAPLLRAFLSAAATENSLITTSQFYRRFMGLEMRDLKRLKGVPASTSALVQQAGSGQ